MTPILFPVPSESAAKALWDVYDLPSYKRIHCQTVADLTTVFTVHMKEYSPGIVIDDGSLFVAALLHDIDKNIPKLPGERHPDAGVRVLMTEGFGSIAEIVSHHALHLILDPEKAPKTWEDKILFLCDKMVKQSVIGVDERFRLWMGEDMDTEAKNILTYSYPAVKILEAELSALAHLDTSDLVGLA